ncbi:MAG: hypothetical protein R3272_16500, partial [Candidatus Promineifilaceae bacterium]|nr:hypothetical protein [Candidatus Promineifilaceae bacterium]
MARRREEGRRRQGYLFQRRVNWRIDQYRPYRWNWQMLLQPLDARLERQAAAEADGETAPPVAPGRLRSLRYFWLDGLFAAISENFYVGFVTLFALAFGATN